MTTSNLNPYSLRIRTCELLPLSCMCVESYMAMVQLYV